jgi:hypothetical protein
MMSFRMTRRNEKDILFTNVPKIIVDKYLNHCMYLANRCGKRHLNVSHPALNCLDMRQLGIDIHAPLVVYGLQHTQKKPVILC